MSYKGFGAKSNKFKKVSKGQLQKWCERANQGDAIALNNINNYYKNAYNEYSKMEGSTMIHEMDYKPMKCCLCGKDMDFIHDTHNPEPLTPRCYAKEAQEKNLPHRCCSECNTNRVNPERMKKMGAKNGDKFVCLGLSW